MCISISYAAWRCQYAAMRRAFLVALLAGAVTAGCGSADPPQRTTAADARHAGPALLRAPRRAGEIVIRGDATPKTTGPYVLTGTYRARFEQYAPEDARLDFSGETAFVADLERTEGVPAVRLFRAAARSGARTLRLHGRYYVDASFGDYPFVIRLTPERG
jgi:hypothetical protein